LSSTSNIVSSVTDEPPESLEALVARRILEQLGAGRLNELLGEAARARAQISGEGHLPVQAQISGEGQVIAPVGIPSSGEFGTPRIDVIPRPEMVAIIDSASFELARDLDNRSP
jgi:hypothetical protein